jgi:hypothetical protein
MQSQAGITQDNQQSDIPGEPAVCRIVYGFQRICHQTVNSQTTLIVTFAVLKNAGRPVNDPGKRDEGTTGES